MLMPSPMKNIKFLHNWNRKLDCDVFTTIRRHTKAKEKYYLDSVGEEFDILLNGVTYCYARLENVYTSRLIDLLYPLLRLDTGASSIEGAFEVFKRFGLGDDSIVIVLTFNRKREE